MIDIPESILEWIKDPYYATIIAPAYFGSKKDRKLMVVKLLKISIKIGMPYCEANQAIKNILQINEITIKRARNNIK